MNESSKLKDSQQYLVTKLRTLADEILKSKKIQEHKADIDVAKEWDDNVNRLYFNKGGFFKVFYKFMFSDLTL